MDSNNPELGSNAHRFNMPGVDGNKYTLESFAEKEILIIIFSCNHCPYVKAYEDRIIKIQSDYRDKVQIIAVNSNDAIKYPEDSFENMKIRSAEKGFNFLYLHDEDQSIARTYGATHTPEIFVYDKERKLAYHGKIDDNWKEPEKATEHYLLNAVDELIKGVPVSVPETFSIGCTIKWK
ncbi:thioredoxin family protein [Bacteroidota bacterium]